MTKKGKVEFKSGLEIHQQLDTHKLFCNCPSFLRKNKPDYEVKRKLHAIAGETGKIDVAAKHEASKGREFIYQGYYDNNCLVELDEEPPKEINQEALKIALQISLFLNCEIVPYMQIMRKTVIDGSNPSGFQRTLLLAKNGYIETKKGKIGIESVCLEEDAARIIEKKKGKAVFRLDRLGIPLVEIATSPDIKDAKQAREVALKLGEILRACKIKRGLGTIRQDVNLSVKIGKKQGSRVEIKGVQEPRLIEKTLGLELARQEKLIKEGKSKPEVRKALPDGKTDFLRPLPGADRMYPETDLPLLHITKEMINNAKKTLPKLYSEKRAELRKHGLNKELIKVLTKGNKMKKFHELLEVYNDPELVGKILTIWMKDTAKKIGKKEKEIEKILKIDILETILQAYEKEKIGKSEIQDVMQEIANGRSVEEALKREKVENLEEKIREIIKKKPGLRPNAYMGLIMKKLKGSANPKKCMEIIKKILKSLK